MYRFIIIIINIKFYTISLHELTMTLRTFIALTVYTIYIEVTIYNLI